MDVCLSGKRSACEMVSKNKFTKLISSHYDERDFNDTTDSQSNASDSDEEDFRANDTIKSLLTAKWTILSLSCVQYCLLHYGLNYRSFLHCPVVGHIILEHKITIQEIRLFLTNKRTKSNEHFIFMNSNQFQQRTKAVEFYAPGKHAIIQFHKHYLVFPDHPLFDDDVKFISHKNQFERYCIQFRFLCA
jgi:hypothetical protein